MHTRNCSRCRKELSDPASLEAGIGPTCRSKNNYLYARTIKADFSTASALILGTHPETLPVEIQERWNSFREDFLRKMQKAQKNNDDPTTVKLQGSDLREAVKDLDYFLSFELSDEYRDRLIKVIEALGYVGLAGVLSGNSSLTKAEVWFESGKIYLQGTSCTPGFRTMKKISGVTTPRWRGDKTPYTAPANEAENFLNAIRRHWPLHDADLGGIQRQADEWVKNHPDENVAETLKQKELNKDTVYITHRSNDFIVGFPWLSGKNMFGMIAKLKEVPYNSRTYNPSNKSWTFKINYIDHVKNALIMVFDEIVEKDSGDMTPRDLYKSQSRKRRTNSRKANGFSRRRRRGTKRPRHRKS